MSWFKRKPTVVSVDLITHKKTRTLRRSFDLMDAKRHIYQVQLSPSESIRVEVTF